MTDTKVCQNCGATFERPTGARRITTAQWESRKFCSQKCAASRKRPWQRTRDLTATKTCANCGRVFQRNPLTANKQWEAQRFCSVRCARTGEHHWNWKGGRHVDFKGYVRVWIPDDHPFVEMRLKGQHGAALEHRIVMAEKLGRPLLPYEQVHHKNGDKQDNRIENLELRVGSHGTGATHAHCPTCTCFEH